MKRFLAIALLLGGVATPALAEGDATAGEKDFKKCKACHAVGEGATDKVGPQLNNVMGRVAGSSESYAKKYSKPMVAAGEGGLVWTTETLSEFLASPKTYMKGTKMSFAGFKKEQDIEDIIAYLHTFSPDYVEEAE